MKKIIIPRAASHLDEVAANGGNNRVAANSSANKFNTGGAPLRNDTATKNATGGTNTVSAGGGGNYTTGGGNHYSGGSSGGGSKTVTTYYNGLDGKTYTSLAAKQAADATYNAKIMAEAQAKAQAKAQAEAQAKAQAEAAERAKQAEIVKQKQIATKQNAIAAQRQMLMGTSAVPKQNQQQQQQQNYARALSLTQQRAMAGKHNGSQNDDNNPRYDSALTNVEQQNLSSARPDGYGYRMGMRQANAGQIPDNMVNSYRGGTDPFYSMKNNLAGAGMVGAATLPFVAAGALPGAVNAATPYISAAAAPVIDWVAQKGSEIENLARNAAYNLNVGLTGSRVTGQSGLIDRASDLINRAGYYLKPGSEGLDYALNDILPIVGAADALGLGVVGAAADINNKNKTSGVRNGIGPEYVSQIKKNNPNTKTKSSPDIPRGGTALGGDGSNRSSSGISLPKVSIPSTAEILDAITPFGIYEDSANSAKSARETTQSSTKTTGSSNSSNPKNTTPTTPTTQGTQGTQGTKGSTGSQVSNPTVVPVSRQQKAAAIEKGALGMDGTRLGRFGNPYTSTNKPVTDAGTGGVKGSGADSDSGWDQDGPTENDAYMNRGDYGLYNRIKGDSETAYDNGLADLTNYLNQAIAGVGAAGDQGIRDLSNANANSTFNMIQALKSALGSGFTSDEMLGGLLASAVQGVTGLGDTMNTNLNDYWSKVIQMKADLEKQRANLPSNASDIAQQILQNAANAEAQLRYGTYYGDSAAAMDDATQKYMQQRNFDMIKQGYKI